MDPDRVPIIRPSRGVSPIEVATDRPFRTAVTEQPLPRCATTRASREADRPSNSAARPVDHSTDNPWKPNLRMPNSRCQPHGTGYLNWSSSRLA